MLFGLAKEGNSVPGHHMDGPEDMTLSAISQPQQDNSWVIPLTQGPWHSQAPRDRKWK